jgi:hypothetical protein
MIRLRKNNINTGNCGKFLVILVILLSQCSPIAGSFIAIFYLDNIKNIRPSEMNRDDVIIFIGSFTGWLGFLTLFIIKHLT